MRFIFILFFILLADSTVLNRAFADLCDENHDGLKGVPLLIKQDAAFVNSNKFTETEIDVSQRFVQGADPFVLQDGQNTRYVFTTNRPKVNVPVYKMEGNNSWFSLGDALPDLPMWAEKGFTWAPEVIRLKSGKYAIWYTARDSSSDKQCIGRGFSNRVEGPYVDQSDRPFFCDEARDTSIDPSPYRSDDGKLFLLWKTKEMISGDEITTIWMARLDDEGNLRRATIKKLLINDQEWEGKHVEAPTLLKERNRYYLFYSAGASTSRGYLVSYATSTNLMGPYTKSNKIVVGGSKCMKGAGHQSIVEVAPGERLIYFHGVHPERRQTGDGKARFLDYAYLCFQRGKPVALDRDCSSR